MRHRTLIAPFHIKRMQPISHYRKPEYAEYPKESPPSCSARAM